MSRSRAVLAVLGGCVLLVVLAAPAGAHSVLVASDPAADALVGSPPSQILLTFSEEVEVTGDAVRLLDPSGDEVQGITSAARATTVRAALPTLDQDGSYTVTWSAVSADGHPIGGAYLFHLRERTLDRPAATVESGTPWSATLLRALGATISIAGLVWVFACSFLQRRPRARWVPVLVGSALGLVGAVVAVGDAGSDGLGVVLDTTSGRMGVVAVVVSAVGLLVSWIPRAGQVELAIAAAATVAVAAQGHAVSLPPVARSVGLTVAHVVAAVAWATTLVWLDRRSRTAPPGELGATVVRLSPWGIGAVVVLAVSGSLLVLDRVPFDELLDAAYGRLALVKVAFLVVAVALAARNRWSIAPTLVRDDEASVRRLRGSVRAEVVVLALALAAGSLLAQVSPPEDAGAVPTGGEFVQRASFGDGEVELTVAPGRRGTNEMHVTALGPDGALMPGIDDLRLSMTLPAEDVGPLEPPMQRITTGHSVSYAEIPLAGRWTIEVTARPSKFEELRATFTVPIGE